MDNERRIIVAVTGASGALYAQLLLEQLALPASGPVKTAIVFSANAEQIWEYELGEPFSLSAFRGTAATGDNLTLYDNKDFYAPFASGSSRYDTMIIIPASMGMVGRIAHGVSDDLITRAADVMLKERRTLILVPRETPYSLIHLNNMKLLTEAGAIIAPATPSFYTRPDSITALALTVVQRVLDLAGFQAPGKRWGE
ncbi:MAG: UbiX family flavin prenyltransferase [Bacteroidales bacterium]|nr:UbiX family flavin prenyltransferase [Bacteroidales bacterium]